jgi:hypothetical protein
VAYEEHYWEAGVGDQAWQHAYFFRGESRDAVLWGRGRVEGGARRGGRGVGWWRVEARVESALLCG